MRRTFGLLIFLLFTSLIVNAQGIEFFKGSWNDALAVAKKENKIIFVDAYASWCGPCKRMAANVFTKKQAGDFYNTNFINFKMDMEKGEGPAFGKKYPVRAYPTLMFIDEEGKLVHKKVGGQTIRGLLMLGQEALKKVDRSLQYAKKYEQGDRDPELVYNYIKALNQAGKSSLKIANEYLRKREGAPDDILMKIVFESTQQVDSRIFDLFTKYEKGIRKQFDTEAVDAKISQAGEKTLATAIEYEDVDLFEEAKSKVNQVCSPAVSSAFAIQADLYFASAMEDYKLYLKALKNYNKELALEGNLSEADNIVRQGMSMAKVDAKIATTLEETAKRIASREDAIYTHHLMHARIAFANGDTKAALTALDKAEQMTENQKKIQQQIQQMRERILN